MKKYKITEVLRVEFVVEVENAEKAISKYIKEFRTTIGVTDSIKVIDSEEFTVHWLKRDLIWMDADDEMEALSEQGVIPIEVDTPPDPDVKGMN
jgi:hypothetical protein